MIVDVFRLDWFPTDGTSNHAGQQITVVRRMSRSWNIFGRLCFTRYIHASRERAAEALCTRLADDVSEKTPLGPEIFDIPCWQRRDGHITYLVFAFRSQEQYIQRERNGARSHCYV